ncbi:winged helix-turn-helix domain-containing protein [Thalassotalea hakodatensis]|uniref:winged helix-turn-helix domain-containing protein n=1 Tax=Thalassotalea hakodatensis TaxID=3030492 RepID=UPI002573CC38|nr:winged helix-turn-helix domain-containing protein [Thalassotalea hakodatensis]
MIYQTLNYQLSEHDLTVKDSAGTKLNIRPKTCQLLLLLVKSSGKPISKQLLLETVWADTIVSEQVVFQSINEIRQLFSGSEVIKTIPKQGYVWLPDVVVKKAISKSLLPTKKTIFFLCSLITIVFTFYRTFTPYNTSNEALYTQKKMSGSIVILPIQNQIEGNDHNWVRLGMMDQVIQRLPNSQHSEVLSTDYVLEVLKRANSPLKDIKAKHIQQIFKVSGAELIVYSKLIGVPHDYQLSYAFYYRNHLNKGILLNRKIQTLIDEFSLLIAEKMGNKVLPLANTYQADFNNELLGRAIEKRLEGDYQLANQLLESIVLSNPENLTAQRILAGNLLRLKLFEKAIEYIEKILPIAQQLHDKSEYTHLLYLKALSLYVTYKDNQATKVAKQALVYATNNNDWLLMAHIKNVQANIAINDTDYALAEELYNEEKLYHKVLHCPVGEAQSWANLAKLAKMQNQKEKFNFAINQAITIAKNRELESQLNYFTKIKENSFNQ